MAAGGEWTGMDIEDDDTQAGRKVGCRRRRRRGVGGAVHAAEQR